MVDNRRIVVPISAHVEILKLLHIAHVGVTKTRATAHERYFWPRMSTQIQQMCELCPVCHKTGKNRPHELMSVDEVTPISELRPTQVVGMNLSGKHYFLMVDKYSGFPMHKLLRGETMADVTEAMTSFCNWLGWPEVVRADYGPCFRTGFDDFLKKKWAIHERSSAYNTASNRLDEQGVQRVKAIICKAVMAKQSMEHAVAECRITRMQGQLSPSEMFFGR